jgi:hypothetical protein
LLPLEEPESRVRVHFGDQGNVISSKLSIQTSYSTILLTSKYYLNKTSNLGRNQLINRHVIHSKTMSADGE